MKPIPTLSFEEGRPVSCSSTGKPTLLFAGELHNSSASSLAYLEREVWPHLRGLHLNAVIAPVCWEDLEPRPGEFDFAPEWTGCSPRPGGRGRGWCCSGLACGRTA